MSAQRGLSLALQACLVGLKPRLQGAAALAARFGVKRLGPLMPVRLTAHNASEVDNQSLCRGLAIFWTDGFFNPG